MNVHYKNIKHLSQSTMNWIQANLSHLGVDKFSCNFIDLKHNTYLPLGCHYELYCEFIEKKHHLNMASRIIPGLRRWNTNEALFQLEQKYRIPNEQFHIVDWALKTQNGFELYCIMSHQELRLKELEAIKQWMHVFSYQGAQVSKYKPKALLHLENRAALTEKYHNFDSMQTESEFAYQKAKFDDLILTGKEQEYIEHLVMHRTHKEIANLYQVTETAVRNVIGNIKRKLGSENMSTSRMFNLLNDCGALASCMHSVRLF